MKRLVIVISSIAALCIGVFVVPLVFAKGKAYSGPSVFGNLQSLQLMKEQWQANGHTNEWPSGEDLFADGTRGRSINERFRRRYGELYFINRTGAPPFAYIPKANGRYRGGELLIFTSNGIAVR
jgi:hypothetical protein